MRKLIAAVVAVVSVGAVALPGAPSTHAEEPAAGASVDQGTSPTPPDDTRPEPEPAPDTGPEPDEPITSTPEPESDTETTVETTVPAVVEDVPAPIEDSAAAEAGPQFRRQVVPPAEDAPTWTPPVYPVQPVAPKCVQQKIEKATSTYQDGAWSAWVDWPGVGSVWDDGRTRTGHHGGTHGENGDRHYAYLVVGERAITTGECAPKWTPPQYPPFTPEPCVEYRLEKATSTWSAATGLWSDWVDWPGAGPLAWGNVPTNRTGHHGGTHGADGDRHFAYVVVDERVDAGSDDPACRPEKPEYEPEVERETTDCQTGDTEVTVTTTTTTYKAVWNQVTRTWDKEVDRVEVEREQRPLDEEEQERCRPTYDPVVTVEEGDCQAGDDVVSFSTRTTTYRAVWNPQTLTWDKLVDEVNAISGVRPLTDEEQAACEPPAKVDEGEWEDGTYECDDTTVEQTRTVTTTRYVYSDDNEWVPDEENSTSVTETRTRELGDDEKTECAPDPSLEFTTLGPVCLLDIPYIRWTVTGEGFDPALPLTIRISQSGEVVETIENAPFEGQVLWPGASADPADWPGWVLNDAGVWVVDPSDAALRGSLTVTASVNPTASGTVEYPEATEACADPPSTPPTTTPAATPRPARAPGGTLPVTGTDVSFLVVLASLIVMLGGGAMIAARRRSAH